MNGEIFGAPDNTGVAGVIKVRRTTTLVMSETKVQAQLGKRLIKVPPFEHSVLVSV